MSTEAGKEGLLHSHWDYDESEKAMVLVDWHGFLVHICLHAPACQNTSGYTSIDMGFLFALGARKYIRVHVS
jgi:hypothetical protein